MKKQRKENLSNVKKKHPSKYFTGVLVNLESSLLLLKIYPNPKIESFEVYFFF